MRRNDRLFELLRLLQDGRLHRGTDLARSLGVSTRTIWRDMATLADRGLPITGERGIGYVLRDPVTLPPVALTKDEFEVLRLGISLVGGAADPVLARASESLRAKIAAVSPADVSDTGADTFVFSSAEAAVAAPLLGLLRRAAREHLTLALSYRDRPPARIRPLHLDYWGKVWTLTCWNESINDFSVFRVDLIKSLELDGGAFMPEAGKTVDDYLNRITRT
ncbi:MAG: HTH domain-containing protein [Rhodobacteraceae bacterium]|nr:HTH domain-containing protein [Paracoccaceae bacterium]